MTRAAPGAVTALDPHALLLRTGQGSRESFAALYDLVAPRVFTVLCALAPDRAAAERLTAAAFREVWVRAPHYRSDPADAVHWVLRIACRAAWVEQRAPGATIRGDSAPGPFPGSGAPSSLRRGRRPMQNGRAMRPASDA